MVSYISTTAGVKNLEFSESFKLLADKEKNYVYFMSKSLLGWCQNDI